MGIRKILDPLFGLAGLAALLISASVTFAEPERHEKVMLKVKTDDGIAETVTIENLEVGESEFVTTESGKEVFVTRDEEGYALEIDGQIIDVRLPHMEGDHTWVHAGDGGQHRKRVMFIDDDANVHEVDGDFVFISEDEENNGGEKVIVRKHVITGDDAHFGDLSDCDIEVISDDEFNEDVLVECLGGHGGADVDVDIISEGDGMKKVIVIKREVEEVHSDDDH